MFLFAMTNGEGIAMCILGVIAVLCGGIVLWKLDDKEEAFEGACVEAYAVAKEWGLDLTADLLKAIAANDLTEIVKDAKIVVRTITDKEKLVAEVRRIYFDKLTPKILSNADDKKHLMDILSKLQAAADAEKQKLVDELVKDGVVAKVAA